MESWFFFTQQDNFQNDLSLRLLRVGRASAAQLRRILSQGIHFRSIYGCLDTLSIDFSRWKSSQRHYIIEKYVNFHWFSLNFIDFRWISLIFIEFHWFSIDFHWFSATFRKCFRICWWPWLTRIDSRNDPTLLKHSKMDSRWKNTSELCCGSSTNSQKP